MPYSTVIQFVIHLYLFFNVLGSILEGPDPLKLKPIVEQAMPMLIELLKDTSVVVRDTAAWTIGRVLEITPDAVINEQGLNSVIQALIEGLNSEPRVASNICWVCMVLYLKNCNCKKRKSDDL